MVCPMGLLENMILVKCLSELNCKQEAFIKKYLTPKLFFIPMSLGSRNTSKFQNFKIKKN